jgi:AcrR family transcriptional regulator
MVTYGGTKRSAEAGRKQRLPAARRRELIEDAAARLFALRGYETTTVDQIVAEAGVSKPMLYRHFSSKKELCMKLLERRRDELAAAPLNEFLAGEGEPEAVLEAMLEAWFEHVEQNPYSSRLLFQDLVGDEDIRGLQLELRRRQRAADIALLREFAPDLPEADLEPLGEIVRSSMSGLALWWLARSEVPRSTVTGAMLRMTRALVAGAR